MDYQVIIPAAGSGKRMGAGRNKLFIEVTGKPVILHTLDVFASDLYCKKIILAVQPNDENHFKDILAGHPGNGKIDFVYGGHERQHSVYNGLKAASGEIILVHDGARPFIRQHTISRLVQSAHDNGAAIAAVPVKDTIKRADQNQVVETVDRLGLWQIQTPQAFRLPILIRAHEQAIEQDYLGTDEASLVEKIGLPVMIIESDYDNIKLTTPEDLYFAEAILAKRKNLG
ncbi:MAG TPA: 2-C-methyl-D-erythritol 4-phosphate cytidylyltransferase [Bacillus bacterium]|uniref:2-C-methyl-D-erythritol 4-phosphate cytidylyltransferase n=1 Tax=Siminovitchia fordii TaxID=254759 RepID=UPI00037B6DBC|nr:2-C-methyl-D-erythritol 4-phosphate cytidylyltransferase [Siminovitchia fordii]HBZ11265.1 2-C-methyl-D-erythritol 4-phosphate cytidylyltransferase [Bacillus sp. (in: firmicutes)]